ncbi:MAG: hypothetical protein LBB43_06780 [Spirochaetaceae bacterium]|jgi:hypothetical protein|nr:hypothetical protein [Spirochaetaceae bacterium]
MEKKQLVKPQSNEALENVAVYACESNSICGDKINYSCGSGCPAIGTNIAGCGRGCYCPNVAYCGK